MRQAGCTESVELAMMFKRVTRIPCPSTRSKCSEYDREGQQARARRYAMEVARARAAPPCLSCLSFVNARHAMPGVTSHATLLPRFDKGRVYTHAVGVPRMRRRAG